MVREKILLALAGQPNCGKSTVFNALTGANQHVANYPGVTVDKMSGSYRNNGLKVEVVDLPGTYSLTSYSLEERVARDFLLHDKPDVILNVMDASNLKQNLYLTLQLFEKETPVVVNLNMMDVADRRGIEIDLAKLEEMLGVRVVPTAIKKGTGRDDLIDSVRENAENPEFYEPFQIDYGLMEPFLDEIKERVETWEITKKYPARWLAVKLMEGDEDARILVGKNVSDPANILDCIDNKRKTFHLKHNQTPERHIAICRHKAADRIGCACIKTGHQNSFSMSDKIDRIVCNRFAGPLILFGVIYLLYNLSIVQGYKITDYTWPVLAKFRSITQMILPDPGFITEPILRSLGLWLVDSANALLNYIPIFFILFALIAVLEDSGYMPRMAFILDRLFKRFGLHGQSTLPMVLGGVYVGGCAVPAVMSTKGIPDERARLATMLIIPMLNCLAKIPLYILIINIYFSRNKGLVMMFMATITLFMALLVAKILTLTVLKKKGSAPFIMEMPPYHIPTVRGVLGKAVERVWLFIKKIVTIVVAVAVILFALLQFPGISSERQNEYEKKAEIAMNVFYQKIGTTAYANTVNRENLMTFILFAQKYKKAKIGVKKGKRSSIDKAFKEKNPDFFRIVKGEDRDGKTAKKALRKLIRARKKLLLKMKKEKIGKSLLGTMGRSIEPLTKWAGFNWRINIALLSSFAAKESAVATLGVIYQQDQEGESLETRMKNGEKTFTQLHALALLLVMALFPPCIATVITIKIQSGSVKIMLFSMAYQMLLGITVASLVFTGGSFLKLTGLQAMAGFWFIVLGSILIVGFLKVQKEYI